MNATLLRWICRTIDHASQEILRRALVLRLPTSRIRLSDIEQERDFCAQRLASAHADTTYWTEQLTRAEEALSQAEWKHSRLLHALDASPRRPSF